MNIFHILREVLHQLRFFYVISYIVETTHSVVVIVIFFQSSLPRCVLGGQRPVAFSSAWQRLVLKWHTDAAEQAYIRNKTWGICNTERRRGCHSNVCWSVAYLFTAQVVCSVVTRKFHHFSPTTSRWVFRELVWLQFSFIRHIALQSFVCLEGCE